MIFVNTKENVLTMTLNHNDFKELPKPVFHFSKVGEMIGHKKYFNVNSFIRKIDDMQLNIFCTYSLYVSMAGKS